MEYNEFQNYSFQISNKLFYNNNNCNTCISKKKKHIRQHTIQKKESSMMEDLKIYITITVIIQLCIVLCIANDGENIPSIRRSNIQSSTNQLCFENGIYFKQLLAGVDYAKVSKATNMFEQQSFRFAEQMKNYVYLIGDLSTGECIVVDGCWDVKGIKRYAKKDGMKIKHYVATHYHYDHIGGEVTMEPFKSKNIKLPGLREFVLGIKTKNRMKRLKDNSVPPIAQAYISEVELEEAAKRTQTPQVYFSALKDYSTLDLGDRIRLTFRHTPGHSPGSMVILVSKIDVDDEPLFMISGDTLFPGSCGRVDLPESDPVSMWDSLQTIKQTYKNDLIVYPGHGYSKSNTTIGNEKRNGLLGITKTQWMSGRKKKKVQKINLYKKET